VDIIQKGERMICPQCSCEQPKTEACAICGVVIAKHRQVQVRQQEIERLEIVKLRSATREVDAWYKNLFDRRVSTLVARILSLLVLLIIFMTCSINSARRNRYFAENTAQMSKAAEGGGKVASSGRNDSIFKERFTPAVEMMASSADACLTQNYNYKASWYQNTQPYFLSENLKNSLSRANRQQKDAETAINGLPTPSQKYYACYVKAKGLTNLNKQICAMANAYASNIPDFSERLSHFNFEFSRINGEINDCKESLK
jgi:hypothetical protein